MISCQGVAAPAWVAAPNLNSVSADVNVSDCISVFCYFPSLFGDMRFARTEYDAKITASGPGRLVESSARGNSLRDPPMHIGDYRYPAFKSKLRHHFGVD